MNKYIKLLIVLLAVIIITPLALRVREIKLGEVGAVPVVANDPVELTAGVGGATAITWINQTGLGTQKWTFADMSADGSKKIIVGDGYMYTIVGVGASTKVGVLSNAGRRSWQTVSMSADGTRVLATVVPSIGGPGGTQYMYYSNNSGATWTTLTAAGSRLWTSAVVSADGAKMVASAGFDIYTSTNSGATWTKKVGVNGPYVFMSKSGSVIGVVGGEYFYTSTDFGTKWSVYSRAGKRNWKAVAVSNDGKKFIAVASGNKDLGGNEKEDNYIYSSRNFGVTWQEYKIGPYAYGAWKAVAISADGTKMMAAGSSKNVYLSIDSGLTWTSNNDSRDWNSVAMSADGTKMVAVDRDRIYTAN